MLKLLWNFSDESRRLRRMLAQAGRSQSVLDVGCGYGRNLVLLRELGFTQLTGVEKNPSLAEEVKAKGFQCLSLEQLEAEVRQYDLVLMSHIVEHFEYADLRQFLEFYLKRLKEGGRLIIVTPLFHDAFYNDFDHVKPYLPMGIQMVFGSDGAQVQFQSDQILRLEDIDFFRDQLRIKFHKTMYIAGSRGWPIQLNRLLKLLYVASLGHVGKKIGWMGLYSKQGLRSSGA